MTVLKMKHVRRNFNKRYSAQKEHKAGKTGHVYICSIGKEKLYKIGKTSNLQGRMMALSAANPSLRCVYSAMTSDMNGAEKFLHRLYRSCKVEREIFRINHVDTRWLDKLIARKFKPSEQRTG
jgi:hypothetical protein